MYIQAVDLGDLKAVGIGHENKGESEYNILPAIMFMFMSHRHLTDIRTFAYYHSV